MTNINPIQKFILDIKFIGINKSNSYLFDKISNLSNNSLVPFLSDLFDQDSLNVLHFEFDSIEIDLGVISYDKFENIFFELFKQALKEKFKDIINSSVSNNNNTFNLKDNLSNNLELIKYFLLNGRLPWWANKVSNKDIVSTIQEFINSNPNIFKTLILDLGKNENVRKRLVYSLPERLIKNLIAILEPRDYEYIFSYHTNVLKINKKENIISEPENSFSKAIWFYIISYLIQNQSSQFQKKQFLKRNLENISTFYNISYLHLLELLFLSTLEFNLTQSNSFYDFTKDIQFIFKEEIDRGDNINKVKASTSEKYHELFHEQSHFNSINNNIIVIGNDYDDLLFIITYYLKYGSLIGDFKFYTIDNLKEIFQKIYNKDPHLVKLILLNVSINIESSRRIFNILNKSIYSFAIDLIVKNNIGISINNIHKSFIQLLISQAKSTNTLLSDDFKFHLLHSVFYLKNSISFKDLISIYIIKCSTTFNISIFDTFNIYINDLKLKINTDLIKRVNTISEIEVSHFHSDITITTGIDNTDILNISVFNLLKYIIDYNYIPWWGKDLYNSGIQNIIDNLFNSNIDTLFLLLKHESLLSSTRLRFFNLIGSDKTEKLLFTFLDEESIIYYNFLKSIYLNNLLSDNITLLSVLWQIINDNNYSSVGSNNFLKEFILYFSNANSDSNNKHFNLIKSNSNTYLSNFQSSKLIKLINAETNFNNILFNKEILFAQLNTRIQSIIKNKLNEFSILENYILEIYEIENNFNQIIILDKITFILNEILIKGNKPVAILNLQNNNINTFIFQLFHYLFIHNKSELFKLIQKFNLFKNDFKYLILEFIFHAKNDSVNEFIIQSLFPLIDKSYFVFFNNVIPKSSILYFNDSDYDIIALKVASVLNIKNINSSNELYEKYQTSLIQYLDYGFDDNSIINEDEVLKFLIISIYTKGQNYLLEIFNNQNYNYLYVNKILSIFSNANNIRDRQIYYLLLSTVDKFTIINNTNNVSFINNSVSIDIKEFVPLEQIFNITVSDNNNTSKTDEIYFNSIHNYLIKGERPNQFEQFNNDQWIHYLKLIVEDLAIKNPSNLKLVIYNNTNNLSNIISLFNLFNSAGSNINSFIRSIFIDFFNAYILNIFKDLNIDINSITINQFQEWFSKTLSNKRHIDFTVFLNSIFSYKLEILNNKNLFIDSNIKTTTLNKTILSIFFNILNDSFTDNNDKRLYNIMLNEFHLINVLEYATDIEPVNYIDNLIIHIYKSTNNKTPNYLFNIIEYINTLTISQPIQLIKIVNYFILKSKSVISFNTIINNTNNSITDLSVTINNDINILKNIYKNEQLKIQNSILKDKLIQSTTSSNEKQLLNESIYINNVGLVLFNLFIPTYFSRLDLLTIEGEFKDEASKFRAVHLLQILVSASNYEEHDLVFNKVLCNLPITDPIPMDIIISEKENELAIELIGVFIQRWDKMKNSSIEHVRAAFFMRDGRLILKEDGWYLTVEKRGYDVILQTLPWAFGVTKFKWMTKTLNTEWI